METDAALADHLATDLEGTFDALLATHQDRLYTIALRVLGNAPDAEEVAQDAFVRAYRALATMTAAEVRAVSLRPWLATIVIRLARNRRRRRADREPPVPIDGLADLGREPRGDRRGEPEAVAAARAEREGLARHLADLPVAMRIAVVLHHVDGLTFPEIAAVVGAPEGTVRARAHRGLGRLRAAIVIDAVRSSAPPRVAPDPRPRIPPPRRIIPTIPGDPR